MPKRHSGLSLLELLLVMVIAAAVLMWSAAPYQRFIEQQAVDTQLARIAAAVMQMRSEAITRNSSVQVCLVNLKSNLDIQGCSKPLGGQEGYTVDEGLLFFIDGKTGSAGVYNSKEGKTVVPRAAQLGLYSSELQYRIRPSGALSTPGVRYTARSAGGVCRQLWLGPGAYRRLTACE